MQNETLEPKLWDFPHRSNNLREHSCFQNVHPSITPDKISSSCYFKDVVI